MRFCTLVPALLACMLCACIPTDFDDRRAEAQTIALEPPEDYPQGDFGQVIIGYAGMLAGVRATRVAASAGPDSPFSIFPVLVGTELRFGAPVADGCDVNSPCGVGAGESLIGIPEYDTRQLCLMATSTESGEIKVRCESEGTRVSTIAGPGGERFGAAAAALEAPHAWGVAAFGAPGSAAGLGAVYRLGNSGPPVALDLSEGMSSGRGLGMSVAIAEADPDTVLLAASTTGRVVLATSDIAMDGTVTTRSRGCVDGTTEAFGESLAIGDFDGDGAPDVAISSGDGPGRAETVQIFAGAAMPAEGSCAGAWPEALTLTCPDVEGIDCMGFDFGVALATGDVNADGFDDLVVGAPGAVVDEVGGAGAVFVFLGAPSIADLARMPAALRHSNPESGADLGRSVATVPGQTAAGMTRDEVAVGAPGAGRIYVFLCSGIPGDDLMTGPRCQPLDT